MTFHVPIDTQGRDHKHATDEVNRWRGHCIDCFARIELAMVVSLEELIASGRMTSLKRTTLFGLRVEMLRKALLDDTFGKKAVPPRKALEALRPVLVRRNALVHGVGKIWIGHGGEWLWQYRFIDNASGQTGTTGEITSLEANEIERILTSNYRRLGDTLQNLVRSL